jgi:hypothetical protein
MVRSSSQDAGRMGSLTHHPPASARAALYASVTFALSSPFKDMAATGQCSEVAVSFWMISSALLVEGVLFRCRLSQRGPGRLRFAQGFREGSAALR